MVVRGDEIDELKRYWTYIVQAATRFKIDEYTIAAIMSRESRCGLSLTPKGAAGTGDFIPRPPRPPIRVTELPPDGLGFGRGLMQLDYDWHAIARDPKRAWAHANVNIWYAAKVLASNRRYFEKKNYPADLVDRMVIASYNCGIGGVLRAVSHNRDIDFYTTSANYSTDVLHRAYLLYKIFKKPTSIKEV